MLDCTDCGPSNLTEETDVEIEDLDREFCDWLERWSKVEIAALQQSDDDLRKVANMIGRKVPKPPFKNIKKESAEFKALWSLWEELELTDGILYRRYQTALKSSVVQCVAPKEIRKFILEQLHNTKLAGHLGVTKTCERVKQRFYWPRYREDVTLWCRKCFACAQTSKRRTKAPLVHELVGGPLERVGLDIIGPLERTKEGNNYILVVVDYFTKWVEAYGIPDQSALTVADKFVSEFVARFGVPERIHSDQGGDFMSHLFKQMCSLLEISPTRCSPYHPASNGLTERMNSTIQKMLSAFVNEYRNNWDDILPYVLFAYRASVQESTGCTPNMLMLGREVTAPIDIMFGRELPPATDKPCYVKYVEWLRQTLDNAFQFARTKMNLSIQRQDKYLKTKETLIQEGTLVWYYYLPAAKKKLARCWLGPYRVIKKLSEVTYVIEKDNKSKVVHVNNLKPCPEDDNVGELELLRRGCRISRRPERYSP